MLIHLIPTTEGLQFQRQRTIFNEDVDSNSPITLERE